MAAVTLEDILRPLLPQLKQNKLVLISKGLSFLYGVGCILVAVLSSFLDWGVLQGSFTVMGVVSGPLLGVFLLGMFVPAANKLGAYCGILAGYCISLWLAVGSTLYPPSAESMGVLPSFIDQCESTNISVSSSYTSDLFSSKIQPKDQGGLHNFYSVSYLYFGAMATSSVVIVGLIVSYATGPTKRDQIKEGLLWWDLSKNKEALTSESDRNGQTFYSWIHNTRESFQLLTKPGKNKAEKTTKSSLPQNGPDQGLHKKEEAQEITLVMLENVRSGHESGSKDNRI